MKLVDEQHNVLQMHPDTLGTKTGVDLNIGHYMTQPSIINYQLNR